jgi:predicted P-loop ATPase
MNLCNPKTEIKPKVGLSIIEVNKNKTPKGSWKEFQSKESPVENWYNHYLNDGYVGIITGQISENYEVIDIDSKNDPTNKITNDYINLIPQELFAKLQVVKTPNGGIHFRYRCPNAVIEKNQILAKHTDGAVLIETRGEGGYVCHHITDYKVVQGDFDLVRMQYSIPEIKPEERELLLTTARSLDRMVSLAKEPFQYKEFAINKFNEEYDGVDLLTKNGWSSVEENNERILLLRPGSMAHHSGAYFTKSKVFFCFSTSTVFNVGKPYNNYQILQAVEGITDYRQTLSLLAYMGYPSETKAASKNKISDKEIASFLNESGIRYNTFIQEVTHNEKVLEELDNNTIFIQLCEHFQKEVSRQKFENVIKSHLITKEDPIQDFIEKYKSRKPVNAISKWVNCLKLKNENVPIDVVTYFVQKWYVGLIAQCLDGEYPNEFFLAILSTKQGVGKTTLLRKYTIPQELQAYRKEVSISDDEDFKLIMSQALLIIDDEMDGRTLNEDKTFKAILSRKELPLRRKYDRRISNLNRRCSFAGCGNQVNVVRERQNRRIIPIEIESIYYKKVNQIDPIDMFMEAYHLFKSGFRYSYDGSDAEKINQLAGDYFLKTDLDEIIDDCIINPINDEDVFQIAAISLVNALLYKYPTFTKKVNTILVGKILADRGIETKRKGSNKQTVYSISKRSNIILVAQDLEQANSASQVGFERIKPQ